MPAQVGSSAIRAVHWVMASTKDEVEEELQRAHRLAAAQRHAARRTRATDGVDRGSGGNGHPGGGGAHPLTAAAMAATTTRTGTTTKETAVSTQNGGASSWATVPHEPTTSP